MAESSRHGGHHFKTILAVVLIAGILGMIVYGNAGRNFLEALKAGKVTQAGLENGKTFGLSLSTDATSLYGKGFPIQTSPFEVDGVCGSIQIGDVSVESSDTRCSAKAENFTGKFDYTSLGSVVFSGTVDSIKLGSNRYSSSTPLKVQMEVIPTALFVAGISAPKLSLKVSSGSIERYSTDGTLKGSEGLTGDAIDINNLLANVELTNGSLKVTGTANSVRSDNFSW